MESLNKSCVNCGGDLHRLDDTNWKCRYCGHSYTTQAVQKNVDLMRQMFDEHKQEIIANLRKNLYDAVTAKYVSDRKVHECCMELKKYLPDDFRANFYEKVIGTDMRQVAQYLRTIDVERNYEDLDCAVEFLISSLQSSFLLELNNLVERAYKKRDLRKFEYYSTRISEEAVKVEAGVYETKLPRDVFVAYSSKDMDRVSELVEELERQKLQCFVAARNLRHGRGSVENYDRLLKEAMDHCKTFVFVSSHNSRSIDCDAWKVEMEYVRQTDLSRAPAYQKDYAKLSHEYKMPRVEYCIDEYAGNVADRLTREFFDGYERVYSPGSVAERVIKQLRATPEPPPFHSTDTAKRKYCTACGAENDAAARFCNACGKSQFVDTKKEYELSRELERLKNRQEVPRTRQSKPALITNVLSFGSCDFNNPFPQQKQYTTVIDRERYNLVYFHLSIPKIDKSIIRSGYRIYDANGNKVYEDESEFNWQSDYDTLARSWIVRGRDGSMVATGTYRAEFWVEDSAIYEYRFKVESVSKHEPVPVKETAPSRKEVYSEKSAFVTLILCLLLGVLGAHNFYVGKKGKGVFFLFTYGGFALGVIIDLIKIITGSFRDKQGRLVSFSK